MLMNEHNKRMILFSKKMHANTNTYTKMNKINAAKDEHAKSNWNWHKTEMINTSDKRNHVTTYTEYDNDGILSYNCQRSY